MKNGFENEEGIVCGRNSVLEAVTSGRNIDCLYLQKGLSGGSLGAIIKECRERHILIKETAREKLDSLVPGENHQGVAAVAAAAEYAELEELVTQAKSKERPPLFIALDGIEDPHNLGAIIRTAEAVSADGVIIPKRRSAGLTAAVAKSACGALEHMPVARVPNMTAALETLKKQGLWIFGAQLGETDWNQADFTVPAVLVIGGEGGGLSRLVKESCDFLVTIPMFGKINSLNASVACGILLYEAVRQRMSRFVW
ncbi:MAG: 23S rRNA (guanosine(2251)-2'-O)-methyltransferase RlmB [Oscillospiraceae bacterium]|jgi:23S rRNA (guanosine2251-2'-O)-methyltransferase|nr:23S rRNA (guanosine(2251)-2'-O)-methyltransferase RlmB [Oscillospiraceae bacterium]